MNILFADDDPKLHIIVRMWLGKNGYEVQTARNGKEAWEKLQSEHFDGLITDVNMPLMNGIELVKATLQMSEPPELIIVLTSRCDIPHLQQEVVSSRVHLFNKPFSPKALAELIKKLDKKNKSPL